MARRPSFFPSHLHPSAYGGVLRKRSRGRGARSVSTRYSMHLVLRSSLARGVWSFVRPKNRAMIKSVLAKQARAAHAELLGVGNAGNHLHLRVKFQSRKQYLYFIRAVAGEIALHIKKIQRPRTILNCSSTSNTPLNRNFWDHRPFSSIVSSLKYVARLKDYIEINHIEGLGFPRAYARLAVQKWSEYPWPDTA